MSITVSYKMGGDAFASAIYNGKEYEFDIYEDDYGSVGDRYIEITNEDDGVVIATIQDAYNIHAVDMHSLEEAEAIKRMIESKIKEYLSSEM